MANQYATGSSGKTQYVNYNSTTEDLGVSHDPTISEAILDDAAFLTARLFGGPIMMRDEVDPLIRASTGTNNLPNMFDNNDQEATHQLVVDSLTSGLLHTAGLIGDVIDASNAGKYSIGRTTAQTIAVNPTIVSIAPGKARYLKFLSGFGQQSVISDALKGISTAAGQLTTALKNSSDFLGLKNNHMFYTFATDYNSYINHVNIRQQDLYWITGSEDIPASSTHNYIGYGVGTRYTFLDAFALKASFEHSVRLPMARELLGNGTTVYANVKLSPEESNNVNAGLFGTYRPASGHTLYYEANGFLRYVDNYIQAVVSEKEGMMQYQNLPAVHIKGVEGEIRYDWKNRLQLQANACYQDARDQMEFKSDGKPSATYNNRVPNKPWLFCNANASYSFYNIGLPESRLRISYDYQWVHWFFLSWEAYGALESKARIPAQHISSLALSYSWKNERYNLSVQCDNLFDATAYDNYKLQKPGRSFFCKFRLFIN